MAFGTGRPSGKQQKQPGSAGHRSQNNKPVRTEQDWADWQRRDIEATEELYQQDLQEALLVSKMEAEQKKETEKLMSTEVQAGAMLADSRNGGKKKKKGKPMTLSEFNQLPPETIPGSDDENEDPSPPPVHTRVPVECQDTRYFEDIASDANKIMHKERVQENFQKHYVQEIAMKSRYQEEIEKLQKKIKKLETRLEEQGAELKNVKGRNARLCKLVADGEMKEKSDILSQVEELTTDKEDLTEQLAALTAELEKERSKNHALKLENDKLKGKHGK